MQNAVLAIDAALGPCSVAVLQDGRIRAFLHESAPQTQARNLISMIEQALREAHAWYPELTQIISTVGPGTFTGLRIGLAAARGIGFATSVRVYGATTLACAALAVREKNPDAREVRIVLNAGKGDVYTQSFALTELHPVSKAVLSDPQQLPHAALVAGNAPPEWFPECEVFPVLPDARHAAQIFSYPHLLLAPEPFYIRPPDALPAV